MYSLTEFMLEGYLVSFAKHSVYAGFPRRFCNRPLTNRKHASALPCSHANGHVWQRVLL